MSDSIAITNKNEADEEETICCDMTNDAQDEDEDSETEGADEVNDNDSEEELLAGEAEGGVATGEDFDEDSESLDPRIQEELEKLNSSTDVINKLEVDLEEARHTFRILMRESGQQLERLAKQIGPSTVEKARPYYEARIRARKAHAEAQRAAVRFEKASNAHEAAKEMVTLAEEGYKERGCLGFDQAWQEMLNHASSKVNDSEAERNASAAEHRAKSLAYSQAESRVQDLQKSLKRNINKSKPYFELKARFNQILDDQKRQVQVIEETIAMTKEGYADSLKELERISEDIHQRRAARQKSRKNLGVRTQGVGAESPAEEADGASQGKATKVGEGCQLCDHDGDETDGFMLNMANENQQSAAKVPAAPLPQQQPSHNKCCQGHKKLSVGEASFSSSSATNTTSSLASSPPKSPTYQELIGEASSSTPQQQANNDNAGKMQFLSVRKLSDDEFSEADSMTSMEQLDDDQIEQLMLESDGYDTLQDAKSPVKAKRT